MESLYEAMAQSFIISLRKNVMRGLSYNAEKAIYNGRAALGYTGRPNSRYEVDEDGAAIVKRIYNEYANGKPMKQISDDLKASGFKTARGNDFSVNSLRRILTNRAYLGEYHWGEYVIEDGMPRLIDPELFERAQRRLEANRHGGKSSGADG